MPLFDSIKDQSGPRFGDHISTLSRAKYVRRFFYHPIWHCNVPQAQVFMLISPHTVNTAQAWYSLGTAYVTMPIGEQAPGMQARIKGTKMHVRYARVLALCLLSDA